MNWPRWDNNKQGYQRENGDDFEDTDLPGDRNNGADAISEEQDSSSYKQGLSKGSPNEDLEIAMGTLHQDFLPISLEKRGLSASYSIYEGAGAMRHHMTLTMI